MAEFIPVSFKHINLPFKKNKQLSLKQLELIIMDNISHDNIGSVYTSRY